jgi:predicted GNAT family acetyltransferase
MTVVDDRDRDRFEISVEAEVVGLAEYHRMENTISFLHTEVDAAHTGMGLGRRLIAFALDTARADGEEVLPYCPFVRHFIRTHPEYLDLVPERRRVSFELAAGPA